ncbi:hypothetical protein ACFQY4_29030 [Catellatospora bangladeshensis]|uniref:hypothetical protein n=1 Tax=Catellatospora bangladeshensis TaxID=310355 RepID=UPI00361EAEFC
MPDLVPQPGEETAVSVLALVPVAVPVAAPVAVAVAVAIVLVTVVAVWVAVIVVSGRGGAVGMTVGFVAVLVVVTRTHAVPPALRRGESPALGSSHLRIPPAARPMPRLTGRP